jgi:hypothetical protein
MSEGASVVTPQMVMLTKTGNAKAMAVKDNKKQCIAFYAIALKQMKLLRLLTKAKTTTWPEGEA